MELPESVKIEKYSEAKDHNLTDIRMAKNGSIADYKTNEQTHIITSKLTSWPFQTWYQSCHLHQEVQRFTSD